MMIWGRSGAYTRTTLTTAALWAILLLGSGVAGSASASISGWTQRGGDAGHSGYVGGAIDPSKITHAWTATFNTPPGGTAIWGMSAVATDGENVYRTARNGPQRGIDFQIVAFDLHTGLEKWAIPLTSDASEGIGEPTLTNGKVWVNRAGHSSNTGKGMGPILYALDSTDGQVLSATGYSAQWGENDRPVTDGSIVVAEAGYYGGMSAYDASDGSVVWHKSSNASSNPYPTLTDDYIFARGNKVYSRDSGNSIAAITHATLRNLSSPTLSPDGPLIYTAYEGFVVYDPKTLGFLWEMTLESRPVAVAAGNGRIVVATEHWVRSYDATTGALQTTYQSVYELRYNEIVLTDSHVFLQRSIGTLALDLDTGLEAWHTLDRGKMAAANGYLLLSDHEGVRAYTLPEPAALAIFGLGVLTVLRRH